MKPLAPQIEGLRRAKFEDGTFKPGFLWYMDMGLGKTATDLIESSEMVEQGLLQREVVIAPNSFKSGWVAEIEKQGFDFSPHVYESGNTWYNDRFANATHNRMPLLIINWEAIKSDSTQEYIRKFVSGKKAKITFDEIIAAKGHDSAQTKAAINIAKEGFAFRRGLCGKPITQGPHDLWGQLRCVGAIDGWDYYRFRYNFCKMGGFKGKSVVGAREGSEERLAELIDPWCFKAEKSKWAKHLPPKSSTIREYKLDPVLQRHFDEMYNDFVTFLGEGEHVAVDAAITKYIKMAQIQAGFIINEDGKVVQLVHHDKNTRLNELRALLRDEVTGKLVIPYFHRHSAALLADALAAYSPAWLGGRNGLSERGTTVEAEKARFNNDPNCRAIFIHNRGDKYGHTLLGDQLSSLNSCSTMAFYENTYSLDDRSQVEDRIHREGQVQSGCLYVDFVGTPLDRKCVEALQRKEDVYQSIMRHVTAGGAFGA